MSYLIFRLLIEIYLAVLPIFLLGICISSYRKNKFTELFFVSIHSSLFIFLIYLNYSWKKVSVLYYDFEIYLVLSILFFSLIGLYVFKFHCTKIQISKKNIFITSSFLILVILSLTSSAGPKNKTIVISPPLKKGTYVILHGGDNRILNHHYKSKFQKYALDIVESCVNESLYTNKFQSNKSFCIWNKPVYAGCDGVVVNSVSDIKDNIPLIETDKINLRGNFIDLKCENKSYILYAHLKKDSLIIKKGDKVKNGTIIGLVGNSGNSSEPHLHIQALDSKHESQVLKFHDRTFKRNDVF